MKGVAFLVSIDPQAEKKLGEKRLMYRKIPTEVVVCPESEPYIPCEFFLRNVLRVSWDLNISTHQAYERKAI